MPKFARRGPWAAGIGATAALAAVLLGTVCLTSGCGTVGYYAQAVSGHLEIMHKAKPVAKLLQEEDSATATAAVKALRERLALSQRMRDFAVRELKLPENASYRSFANLGREAVVWNVVAAPELSFTLKTWCFVAVGCVGYRGYFNKAEAEALAAQLRAEGLDVNLYGVPAYSTLGKVNWLGGDPLLNTFIHWNEGDLARLIFHELAHQVAYAEDDTMFNESFATAVERLGGARWLAAHASAATQQADALGLARRVQFRAFANQGREALAAVYARKDWSDAQKRQAKAQALAAWRANYQSLKTSQWGGWGGYDAWVASANNATLGVQAAYNELVPQFERLFEREGSDFERFYAAVKRLAAMPKAERRVAFAATNN